MSEYQILNKADSDFLEWMYRTEGFNRGEFSAKASYFLARCIYTSEPWNTILWYPAERIVAELMTDSRDYSNFVLAHAQRLENAVNGFWDKIDYEIPGDVLPANSELIEDEALRIVHDDIVEHFGDVLVLLAFHIAEKAGDLPSYDYSKFTFEMSKEEFDNLRKSSPKGCAFAKTLGEFRKWVTDKIHEDKERIHGSWHPYADRSRLILDGHTVELGESSDSNISMLERGWSRDPIATYPLIPSPASSYTPDIQPAEEKVRSDNTANASDDWFNNMPF